MQRLEFSLAIPAEDCLLYYQGHIKYVKARTDVGLSVRFPASVLQTLLKPEGVYGRFAIYYDKNGKFIKIEAIGT